MALLGENHLKRHDSHLQNQGKDQGAASRSRDCPMAGTASLHAALLLLLCLSVTTYAIDPAGEHPQTPTSHCAVSKPKALSLGGKPLHICLFLMKHDSSART